MGEVDLTPFFFGLTFVLHLFFAAGVFSAARGLRARGEGVMFAPPMVWALLTLLWGMFVLLPYWLIHHSSLRPREPGREIRSSHD
jgi:hypothetical protein